MFMVRITLKKCPLFSSKKCNSQLTLWLWWHAISHCGLPSGRLVFCPDDTWDKDKINSERPARTPPPRSAEGSQSARSCSPAGRKTLPGQWGLVLAEWSQRRAGVYGCGRTCCLHGTSHYPPPPSAAACAPLPSCWRRTSHWTWQLPGSRLERKRIASVW